MDLKSEKAPKNLKKVACLASDKKVHTKKTLPAKGAFFLLI